MHAPFINHRVRLAEAIVRDILRPIARPQQLQQYRDCFACGRSFTYRGSNGDDSGRFCSSRCRVAYDAGFPRYEPPNYDKLYRFRDGKIMPIGPTGFLIECASCRKRFDSRGLRCCSTECERKLGRKQELEADLKNDPFRAVKRKCEMCGSDLPNWRKGRRVSSTTRFCSDRCRKSAGRVPDSPNPVLSAQTTKKCPKNKGFLGVEIRPTPLVPSRWEPASDIDPAGVPDLPEFLRRS
jgi:hypothetical protein